jgi:hypothetical protein
MDLNPKFATEGTFTPDNLHAGDFPQQTETVVVAAGQNLLRGAVLGKITASGKYVLSTSAAADGSQTPTRVLLHDTNAVADTRAPVAITGEFNSRRVILGAGHTVAGIRDGLAANSLFLVDTIPA